MGNEVSTVGGAIGTAATGVAVGVTFGQCSALNNACAETAKFTGSSFMKTNVRHVGELAGVSVAAAATLGQCEAVNQCVRNSAKATAETAGSTVNDIADGVPIVGHIKGGIHYACGDKNGGDKAMKSASRTIGVVGGGVAGVFAGGPVGAVVGGISGGAAMDGIITGADSSVHGEYRPHGQVAAWTAVARGEDAQSVVAGVVGGVITPVFDGLAGAAAGKAVVDFKGAKALAAEQDLKGTSGMRTSKPAYDNSMSAGDPRLTDASLTKPPTSAQAAQPTSSAPTSSAPTSSAAAAPAKAASSASRVSNGSAATSAATTEAASAATSATTEFSVRDSCLSDVHDEPPNGIPRHPARAPLRTWREGKWKYVVKRRRVGDYEVHLQDFRRAGYCHADCAGGINSTVVHAGEIELGVAADKSLFVKRFNSASGHFKPSQLAEPFGADFRKAAGAFETAGLRLHHAGQRATYQGMIEM